MNGIGERPSRRATSPSTERPEEEQAEFEQQRGDVVHAGAYGCPERRRSSCSRPVLDPMATSTSPARSWSAGRGRGRRRRRGRSRRSSSRSACGPGCRRGTGRRTGSPGRTGSRADCSPGTSWRGRRTAGSAGGRRAPRRPRRPPPRSAGRRRGRGRGRGGRTPRSRRRPRAGRRCRAARPTGSVSSYRTPTPGSSVSSSSTPGSSQNGWSGQAVWPAVPRGAGRAVRRAGRAGCGRRSRRPARRRVRKLPHGGQQLLLGDRHRDVVVAPLDPPVAGQPAAAAEPGDARAGPRSSCGVGRPAHDRGVVAVRLGDDLQPGQRGGSQPGVAASSSASVRVPAASRSAVRSPPTSSSASLRSTAVHEGSTPDDRHPGSTSGARLRRCAPGLPGAVELTGGDPGQPAAGVGARDLHAGSRPPRARARRRAPPPG